MVEEQLEVSFDFHTPTPGVDPRGDYPGVRVRGACVRVTQTRTRKGQAGCRFELTTVFGPGEPFSVASAPQK